MTENRKTGGSDRFQTIVAILIAVVSVVTAGVIWRASLAGSNASTADRRGLVTTVQYEAAYAETVSMLYEEAHYAAQFDYYQARVEALQAQGDPAARSEAGWVSQIVDSLASFTPLTTDPAYRTADGRLNLDARLATMRAADASLDEFNPQQHFTAADWFYFESELLISAVIIFAVALFFLTLAEITRRRIRIGLAVVGVLVFLFGLGGVVVAEAYVIFSRLGTA
jgi:hypothetical protein